MTICAEQRLAPVRPGGGVQSLGNTDVTGAGLKEIVGLKELRTLAITGDKVTDVGLQELAGLKELQTLVIGGDLMTDAGLKNLWLCW